MPEGNLKRELIRKEDGRYLYLYTWSGAKKMKSKPVKMNRSQAGTEREKSRK